jgi:hypothetical protein
MASTRVCMRACVRKNIQHSTSTLKIMSKETPTGSYERTREEARDGGPSDLYQHPHRLLELNVERAEDRQQNRCECAQPQECRVQPFGGSVVAHCEVPRLIQKRLGTTCGGQIKIVCRLTTIRSIVVELTAHSSSGRRCISVCRRQQQLTVAIGVSRAGATITVATAWPAELLRAASTQHAAKR